MESSGGVQILLLMAPCGRQEIFPDGALGRSVGRSVRRGFDGLALDEVAWWHDSSEYRSSRSRKHRGSLQDEDDGYRFRFDSFSGRGS